MARRNATYFVSTSVSNWIDVAWRTHALLDGTLANGPSDYIEDLVQRYRRSRAERDLAPPIEPGQLRRTFVLDETALAFIDGLADAGKIRNRSALINSLVEAQQQVRKGSGRP